MMRTYSAVQVIKNRYFIHILKIRQWSLLGKKKGRKKGREGVGMDSKSERSRSLLNVRTWRVKRQIFRIIRARETLVGLTHKPSFGWRGNSGVNIIIWSLAFYVSVKCCPVRWRDREREREEQRLLNRLHVHSKFDAVGWRLLIDKASEPFSVHNTTNHIWWQGAKKINMTDR